MPKLLTRLSFKLFLLGDRAGVHILPKHYYTPVPDYTWLLRNRDLWTKRVNLIGIHWDLDEQLQWLAETCGPYYHEVAGLELYRRNENRGFGPGFGAIESQVLHCFVRTNAPPRIVEIGGGVSTASMVYASECNRNNGRNASHITSIEPYPSKGFSELQEIDHIRKLCQRVPSSVFQKLTPGDLLSIDSSHSVKADSDVLRIYLEILPGLRPGIFVHIHDIFLPYLYQRSTLHEYFASQETALLLALLINNKNFSVLSSLSALHYDRTAEMMSVLTDYKPQENSEGLKVSAAPTDHFPNSIWLKTC